MGDDAPASTLSGDIMDVQGFLQFLCGLRASVVNRSGPAVNCSGAAAMHY